MSVHKLNQFFCFVFLYVMFCFVLFHFVSFSFIHLFTHSYMNALKQSSEGCYTRKEKTKVKSGGLSPPLPHSEVEAVG